MYRCREGASTRKGPIQVPWNTSCTIVPLLCGEPLQLHQVTMSLTDFLYQSRCLVVAVADADGIAIARPHRKRVDFKL